MISRKRNILRVTQLLSFLLLLTTLTVASAHEYVFDENVPQEISDEEAPDSEERGQLSISAVVQANFNINLGFDSFLLQEFVLQQNGDTPSYVSNQFILSISKGFKVLLQLIISTNAP